MTAEEVVISAYQAFGAGDMEALAELNHPECTYTFHAEHASGGTYHGFPAFLEGVLSKLNDAWPGFVPEIDKVVCQRNRCRCVLHMYCRWWVKR